MSRFPVRLAFAALPALVLAACGSTPPRQQQAEAPPPFTLERFRDEQKLGENVRTVVLDNPYGEIQVRQTQAGAIAIQGVEQRIGETPRVARIEWFEEDSRQGVRIRYAEHDPETPANPRLGRVDLYAFVPPGLRVDLRSDFGAIVVRRIDDEVVARSRTGTITVAARGAMDLESREGQVRAWTMSADWNGPVRLVAGGGVLVDVPLFLPLDLQAGAAEGISADFELDSLVQGADGRWQARHRLGEGTLPLRIESGADITLQGVTVRRR